MKVRAKQDGIYGGYYRIEGDIFEIDPKPYEVKDSETGKPVIELDENGKPRLDAKGKPKAKTGSWFAPEWMEEVPESMEITNDYPPFQIPSVYVEKKSKGLVTMPLEPKPSSSVI